MLGIHYRCSKCDFEFSSGWSHHAAGQFLACSSCSELFVLGGGQSEWGVQPDDILTLVPIAAKDFSNGVWVAARPEPIPDGEDWNGVSYVECGDLACPSCGSQTALVQRFESGERCPKCKEGTVVEAGSCIY